MFPASIPSHDSCNDFVLPVRKIACRLIPKCKIIALIKLLSGNNMA